MIKKLSFPLWQSSILKYLPFFLFTLFSLQSVAANSEQVLLNGKISQKTLVQNSDNTVYLDISIKAPTRAAAKTETVRPSDMMIILDRSGSMAAEKKMSFAKAAIHDVLSQLTSNDRFALVSFSDNAIVHSSFVAINAANRENLHRVVDTIPADGSTNMGDGLQSGLQLMSSNRDHNERLKKVLLLSDGQANQGLTEPRQLASIVTQITKTGAVLSTIGMGLDFNETLMATLADYGMGHYSYLEELSGLGAILEKDLSDTRSIYATASFIDVILGNNVTLVDAGGYPITQISPNTVRITTGQILDNTDKSFVMTFTVPNQKTGSLSLGQMQLNYQAGKSQLQTRLAEDLKLTVVESSRQDEALKSVDSAVYKKTWTENNLGRMKKALSDSVRAGNKAKAQQAISDYRQAVEKAQKASNVPLLTPEVEKELTNMNNQVEESFKGEEAEQDVKRKRSAKSIQNESIINQRSMQK
jgi:Ca-activated chloride channel family protein